MFKTIMITFALIALGMVALHSSLQDGSLLRFMDQHPNPTWVPPAEYAIGQGYYLMHDLQNAATNFIRISERYPNSSYADDAYFYYLQSVDEGVVYSHVEMVDRYQSYLDRFPKGKHVARVEQLVGDYRSGR